MHAFLDALRAAVADLFACLRFYTRLPVPVLAFEPTPYGMLDFSRAIRMLPIAGAIVGGIGALVLILGHAAGLPPLAASGLALAALLLTTGVFHEDGLADTADGLGGGATVERKLEIMKDSRIGSYGGAALVVSLLLRVALMAALVEQWSSGPAALALIAAAGASRTAALAPMALLPPARKDGPASAGMTPGGPALGVAATLAALLCVAAVLAGMPAVRMGLAVVVMVAGALAMTEIARRQIGGHTGDVGGAAQQIGEILFLCALAAQPAL